MKVHDRVRSPNPRRLRILLAEKGVKIHAEKVDFARLAHRGEGLYGHQPDAARADARADGGTAIAEPIAFRRYFEAIFSDPPLFGEPRSI